MAEKEFELRSVWTQSLMSFWLPHAKASPLLLCTSLCATALSLPHSYKDSVLCHLGWAMWPKKAWAKEDSGMTGWVCEEEETWPFFARKGDKTSAKLQVEMICDRNGKPFFSFRTTLHPAEKIENAPDQRISLTLFILIQILFFKPGTILSLTQPGNLYS